MECFPADRPSLRSLLALTHLLLTPSMRSTSIIFLFTVGCAGHIASCVGLSLVTESRESVFVAELGLLIDMASLSEHRLWGHELSSCGSWGSVHSGAQQKLWHTAPTAPLHVGSSWSGIELTPLEGNRKG